MGSPIQQLGSRIEIPLASPFSSNILSIERTPWCRSQPHVPVNHVSIGCWFRWQPRRINARNIDRSDHFLELTKLSIVNHLYRLLKVGDASTLSAGLENTSFTPNRFIDSLAIVDGKPAGFLAVDIFARVGSHHGCRRMPAISGRNQYRIDVLSRQNLSEITKHFAVRRSIG